MTALPYELPSFAPLPARPRDAWRPAIPAQDDPGDELAGLGRWRRDAATGGIALSGVAARFLGVERSLPLDACLANVEPDDRDAVRAAFAAVDAGAGADCEFRVRTAAQGRPGCACGPCPHRNGARRRASSST